MEDNELLLLAGGGGTFLLTESIPVGGCGRNKTESRDEGGIDGTGRGGAEGRWSRENLLHAANKHV